MNEKKALEAVLDEIWAPEDETEIGVLSIMPERGTPCPPCLPLPGSAGTVIAANTPC